MSAEHVPTEESRKRVKAYVGYGLPQELAAKLIGTTFKTLQKHYKEEIELGKAEAHATVVNCLFQSIKKGNITAAIFWLKTQLGWKETTVNELTGNLQIEVNVSEKHVKGSSKP